ncbi:ABC transporter substrate-binding protein [Rhodococcus sp. HNM0563]|uniref:ABC transporter substrate-binding protein n=1 Tax=Rhodococcus sp. F64268 TaxID=2926402 RepID=UPI00146D1B63|nr:MULTISPECIES: ABC transporter substrate-binding protein [unclassified Rhodococcus (in: high G+C Gram-positive bacteria)]MCK0090156.1 ABC transporter substrate-binding protein [Rhodococcus sp. F64268]NLU64683.1 ABC transporter substrate-binding protein [Rhodococcus sp. HNM0563]
MIRRRRIRKLPAALLSLTLFTFVAACGSGDASDGGATGNDGEPVAGGSATILEIAEPPTLDPAKLSNTWAHMAPLGNALYGTLMVNSTEDFEIEYKMATDFATTDGGTTFDLKLRPGLTFTDGTPLDAAAVKYNWDRLKEPATGSTAIRVASQIANTDPIDAETLRVTLVAPNLQFAQGIAATSLNWIASPTALEKGATAFDDAPAGAGPFKVVRWTRQGEIEMEKNPDYWDAPKPYLDTLTIRTAHEATQRMNAMTTGAADLASESSANNIIAAEAQGLNTEVVPTGGGQIIAMNHRRAPFDDIRARQAVQLALDTDNLNLIVYNGEGVVPETLFAEESPYYQDLPFPETNSEEAQKLFDELAAEGKPVSFTFMSYPASESKTLAEAVQAQLSAYDNVDVKVEIHDITNAHARTAARDFDMSITSAIVQDPDYGLWSAFHSTSPGNFMGVSDPELDEALDRGRESASQDERVAAYNTVEERLADLSVGVFYTKATPGVIYGEDVHGVELYTLGSPLVEEIWIN